MRKNVNPSTGKKDVKNGPPFVFDTFSRGTIQDPPASEISDALADSLNLTIYPRFYEGRVGCKLFTSTRFPPIEGRTGYLAHKVGNHIVSDSGDIFNEADVGNFWCWGSVYEFIIGYVNAHEVITETSIYRDGVNCSIMGSLNAFFWHSSQRLWILSIGTQLYTAEWDIPAWEKMLIISRDEPFNSLSDYAEYLGYSYLFNGNGLYKKELGIAYPLAYRVNLDPPNVRINSVPNFAGATCRYRYLYSAARFEREGIIVDRQTPSKILLETGTNVADERDIDYAEVYTTSEISSANPNLVTELWVPVVPNTDPVEYQWHLTHFPIYRSYNLEAKNPDDIFKEKYNDPQRFVWDNDLRVCGAFYVMIEGDRIRALRGEFEIADTFSILELDTGERFEILEWISSIEVRVADDYYYGNDHRGPYAACIGNGRVMRATVTGDILTRTHGDVFTAANERQALYNCEGYRLYITEYIDANRVRIHISGNQPVQGYTIGATHRKFYDTMDDTQLRAREDFYSCMGRYRQALPSCNVGKFMPSFVVVAYRGQKRIYYSQLNDKFDYFIGNYVPTQVNDKCRDAIQAFWLFQDVLAIFCATTTRGIQIGLTEFTTLPESNEAIPIIPGIKDIDMHTGCLDIGSIKEVEKGLIELITNEPGGEALRQFNGSSYSEENYLVDNSLGGRIVRALEKTRRLSVAIYDGFMGYIFWRKAK